MYLTFGEIMMRIIPEGFLRFRQALPGRVEAMFAGGEANVCASLAMFGCETRYLTAIPDNAITQSLLAALKGLGIDTSGILMRKEGRLGIYFLEQNREARSQKPEARSQRSGVRGRWVSIRNEMPQWHWDLPMHRDEDCLGGKPHPTFSVSIQKV